MKTTKTKHSISEQSSNTKTEWKEIYKTDVDESRLNQKSDSAMQKVSCQSGKGSEGRTEYNCMCNTDSC